MPRNVALSQPEVGGLQGLINHPALADKLSILPDFGNTSVLVSMFIIPIAVQWWSVWYPGAEPGGGGYIAQRMLAAKDEKNAIGATLFFNFAHYALLTMAVDYCGPRIDCPISQSPIHSGAIPEY